MKLILPLFLAFIAATAHAQICEERELGRIQVTELPFGAFYDSHQLGSSFGFDVDGYSRLCGEPLQSIEYEANLFTYDPSTLELVWYQLWDSADVIAFLPNGSRYTVRSRRPGGGEYDITFVRRNPAEVEVEVLGQPAVIPHYDPSTIMQILTEENGQQLLYLLDYREAQ